MIIKLITVIFPLLLSGYSAQYSHRQFNEASNKAPLKIGDQAPDIQLKTPKGKTIKLSKLKGNLVLVDFWASWCRPCRIENPNVVSAYDIYSKKKFKDAKGFKVYSVSLDKEKAAWEKAIEKDKLHWKQHVSELKGWKSAVVKTYGIKFIPSNFLLDKDGKIIAINLKGEKLHLELEKHVQY